MLGSESAEIRRLDAQAESIAAPTDVLLRAGGIQAGMSVLDLGTGLGHVAFALAGLVGPAGSVLGVDQDPRLLALAEERGAVAGLANVRFAQAPTCGRSPLPADSTPSSDA